MISLFLGVGAMGWSLVSSLGLVLIGIQIHLVGFVALRFGFEYGRVYTHCRSTTFFRESDLLFQH